MQKHIKTAYECLQPEQPGEKRKQEAALTLTGQLNKAWWFLLTAFAALEENKTFSHTEMFSFGVSLKVSQKYWQMRLNVSILDLLS